MALLGPYFFVIYGWCNWISSQRESVPTFFWEWERKIPFVPIFIIPYMSIDALFAASVFLCKSRRELHTVAARILFAISASAICFLLFPLHYAFHRPVVEGWLAPVFAPLAANDLPFNLAPSLHISLRAILWAVYGRNLSGVLRSTIKTWFILIGLSTLLVWQHHFVDVIAGFVMALITFYVYPDRTCPAGHRSIGDDLSRKLGFGYLGIAGILALLSPFVPYGLWLLWPALSLGLVAAAYLGAGTAIFQKHHGCLSAAVEWALLPWLLTTAAIRRHWRHGPAFAELPGNVLFGRLLSSREAKELIRQGVVAVIDLAAESNEARPFLEGTTYWQLSILDITSPSAEAMVEAATFIEEHCTRGKIYVHCALGVSRSAAIAAAWLLHSGASDSVEHAIATLQSLRPGVRLRSIERATLHEFLNRRRPPAIPEPETVPMCPSPPAPQSINS